MPIAHKSFPSTEEGRKQTSRQFAPCLFSINRRYKYKPFGKDAPRHSFLHFIAILKHNCTYIFFDTLNKYIELEKELKI